MTSPDIKATHRRFAAECFNGVWELLENSDRSATETAEMIHMAHASLWHWQHSGQATPKQYAVGTWQLSRVYVVVGHPDEARRYGEESLRLCHQHALSPFYLAYAHEALARVEASGGNDVAREYHLAEAKLAAGEIATDSDRQALLDDLATI